MRLNKPRENQGILLTHKLNVFVHLNTNPTFAQYLNAITKGTSFDSSFPRAVKWFVVRQAFSFPALTLQKRPLVGVENEDGKEKEKEKIVLYRLSSIFYANNN